MISDKGCLEVTGAAFMHCRLDYCNTLLAETFDIHIKRLQSVQNTVARLVSGARRRDHIASITYATSTRF